MVTHLIESYEFGSIVINGKKYVNDVIVFSEQAIHDWWRKEGHKLQLDDLDEILEHKPKPEVVVVGTGYYGLVEVTSEVENALKSHKIKLIAQSTEPATQTFNGLLKNASSNNKLEKEAITGAFHLTC